MSKDNSGPAFPASNDANVNGTMGMTLRDYLAGQALAGDLANNEFGAYPNHVRAQGLQNRADLMYRIADAMLRARQQ